MKVVAISRTIASGGEDIGRLVAEELGFRYVDDEVVANAALMVQGSTERVAKVESSPSTLDRMRITLGRLDPESLDQREVFENRIVTAIFDMAHEGNMVIVAHGASIPLASREDVLRILITASSETRAARILAEGDQDNIRAAIRQVGHSDRERRNFFRRFYSIRQELPTHYDLVINTDRMTDERAKQIIEVVPKN